MKHRPTIGLLAGMGVTATAPFLELVIEECQRQYGAAQQPDYPQMIVFSWPTPFWADRPVDHDALCRRIGEGLRWLASTGVDFMAIPANTPHLYYEALRRQADVPLLNLIEAVVDAIPSYARRVALLATRATRDGGLYARALDRLGVELIAPDEVQHRIDRLLATLWRAERPGELTRQWREILSHVAAQDVDLALLACTDLNAVSDAASSPVPILDATRVMAAKVVATWCGLAGVTPPEPA